MLDWLMSFPNWQLVVSALIGWIAIGCLSVFVFVKLFKEFDPFDKNPWDE